MKELASGLLTLMKLVRSQWYTRDTSVPENYKKKSEYKIWARFNLKVDFFQLIFIKQSTGFSQNLKIFEVN